MARGSGETEPHRVEQPSSFWCQHCRAFLGSCCFFPLCHCSRIFNISSTTTCCPFLSGLNVLYSDMHCDMLLKILGTGHWPELFLLKEQMIHPVQAHQETGKFSRSKGEVIKCFEFKSILLKDTEHVGECYRFESEFWYRPLYQPLSCSDVIDHTDQIKHVFLGT